MNQDDGIERIAYPRNGDAPQKRHRGRPPGIPNPNGGRPKNPEVKPPSDHIAMSLDRVGIGLMPREEWRMISHIFEGIPERHVMFIMEYMLDLNAAAAARRCHYANANVSGCMILNDPDVRRAVDMLLEIRVRNQVGTVNRMLIQLEEMANFQRKDLYDENGCLLPIHKMPPAAQLLISGMETFEKYEGEGEDRKLVGYVKKVHIKGQNRARELLAKHYGIGRDPTPSVNQNININQTQVNVNAQVHIDASSIPDDQLEMAVNLGLARLRGNGDGQVIELMEVKE